MTSLRSIALLAVPALAGRAAMGTKTKTKTTKTA
jgi:hypothetical protein